MDQEMLGKELQRFNVTDAAIAKMSEEYMALTIKDLSDKDGFDMVHKARMNVKGKRISVEKTRKELKEDALRYGQAIDKEAKRITALLEPIENHLDSEEGKIQAEKDHIKAVVEAKEVARLQARVDTICAFGAIFNGQTYTAYGLQIPVALVKTCTDEQFSQFIAQIQAAKAEDDAKRKAEEARRLEEQALILKVQQEQEAERQRLVAEAKKQVEEMAREKEAIEAKEKAIREEREAIEKEKQRLLDEKMTAENEKRRQAELEQAKKEATEKALQDAKEKAEREAAAKIEAERKAKEAAERKAARAPDKVKILLIADTLDSIQTPDVKTEDGKALALSVMMSIAELIKIIRDKAEAL